MNKNIVFQTLFLFILYRTMITMFLINTLNTSFRPLSANPTKWSNKLKQFAGCQPANCLRVFDHFMRLALKGLSGSFKRTLMKIVREKKPTENKKYC